MEKMYGIIYEALNKTNDKVYVGQTTWSLEERKRTHHSCAVRGAYDSCFMRALRKYQETDWEWNTLQVAYCKEELSALEKYWMCLLDSMAPNGYNTKEAGVHGKHTKETCKQISETLTGYKRSKDACKNISESKKGNTYGRGNKNKKKSKEACENISKGKKDKCMGANHWNSKTIKCVETGKIYGAIHEAARETGIHLNGISMAANKKRKTAGEFHWKFVNEH